MRGCPAKPFPDFILTDHSRERAHDCELPVYFLHDSAPPNHQNLIHIRRRAEEATGPSRGNGATGASAFPLNFQRDFSSPNRTCTAVACHVHPCHLAFLTPLKINFHPKKGAKNHRPQENPAKRWSKKQTEIPVTGGRTRTGTASIVLRFCQDYCHNPWCATCLSQKNPACSVNIREYSHSCAFV